MLFMVFFSHYLIDFHQFYNFCLNLKFNKLVLYLQVFKKCDAYSVGCAWIVVMKLKLLFKLLKLNFDGSNCKLKWPTAIPNEQSLSNFITNTQPQPTRLNFPFLTRCNYKKCGFYLLNQRINFFFLF